MKKVFITFGDGSSEYKLAARRLAAQAKELNLFDDIIVADLAFIQTKCSKKYGTHCNFFSDNERGFGYWLWKPIIISYMLDTLPDQTIILYADSGCEIFPQGKKSMSRHLALASKYGAFFFRLPYHEGEWTKADLFEHPMIKVDTACSVNQVHATYFFITKTAQNISLVKKWLLIAEDKNYHYLNDSPSIALNHRDYVEHRHDQSILSCLVHTLGVHSKGYAYDFSPRSYFRESPFLEYFIHPLRNKSGLSILSSKSKFRPRTVFTYRITFLLDKLKFSLKVFWARYKSRFCFR